MPCSSLPTFRRPMKSHPPASETFYTYTCSGRNARSTQISHALVHTDTITSGPLPRRPCSNSTDMHACTQLFSRWARHSCKGKGSRCQHAFCFLHTDEEHTRRCPPPKTPLGEGLMDTDVHRSSVVWFRLYTAHREECVECVWLTHHHTLGHRPAVGGMTGKHGGGSEQPQEE